MNAYFSSRRFISGFSLATRYGNHLGRGKKGVPKTWDEKSWCLKHVFYIFKRFRKAPCMWRNNQKLRRVTNTFSSSCFIFTSELHLKIQPFSPTSFLILSIILFYLFSSFLTPSTSLLGNKPIFTTHSFSPFASPFSSSLSFCLPFPPFL